MHYHYHTESRDRRTSESINEMQETEPEGFSSIDRTNNNINPGPSSHVGYEGESRQHEDLQLQEQDTSGDVESWKNQSSIQQPGSSVSQIKSF